MDTTQFRSWFMEKALPFLKAIGIVAASWPWLMLAYSVIAPYMAMRDKNDQEAVRGFIEWFGTAYSFFLALAIVNVWSQFETVEREFDRELDAVSTLLQTVKYTGVSNKSKEGKLKEFKKRVIEDIQRYVTHVVNNYKFEHLVSRQHQNGDRILERIGTQISSLASNKVVPEPFVDELFHNLNEATDVRGDRISHSKPYTPGIIKLVALIASIIWLLSFLGLVMYDKWVAGLMLGGVAFVIIIVLVIFFDLGEPFGGIWKIHLDDWDEFLKNMGTTSAPEVIFIYNLKSTVMGQIRSLIRRDTCNLYRLTHEDSGRPWREFLEKAKAPRVNVEVRVGCSDVHTNDLNEQGLQISCTERPLVVLECGEDQVVLLTSQEINNCQTLTQFERLFNEKIREQLPWF